MKSGHGFLRARVESTLVDLCSHGTNRSMNVNMKRRWFRRVAVVKMIEVFDACCQPVTAGVLDETDAEELAAMFKALADPARLRLLSMVASSSAGEVCACDLVGPSGKSQPTVSHHMAMLVDAGLVTREKRGKWAWYSVVPERLAGLRNVLTP